MPAWFDNLFSVFISFCVDMVVLLVLLLVPFTIFQGLFRTVKHHEYLVGRKWTIRNLHVIAGTYIRIAWMIRQAPLVADFELCNYRNYHVGCMINYFTRQNDAYVLYIRKENSTEVDSKRVMAISHNFIGFPNWAHPDAVYVRDALRFINSANLIMAIVSRNEIKRWGIIPVVVALSILTLPESVQLNTD